MTCFFTGVFVLPKEQLGGGGLGVEEKQNQEYSRVRGSNHNIPIIPNPVSMAERQAPCIFGNPHLLCL